ncbi:MAG: LolA family protein [Bacteroidia bacterium]
MRNYVVYFLGLFTFMMLFTQNATAQTVQGDEKAIKILNASKSKFETMGDFTASFKYSLAGATQSAAKATKQGKIKYKKGKFRITLPDQEMFCNKKKIWVYMKSDNEVNVSHYGGGDAGIDIEAIFKSYQNGAKAAYSGQENINGMACHRIDLASTNKKLDYNQAKLWINTKTNFLEKVTLVDRRQTQTTYEFSNVKMNNGLSDKEFEFNAAAYPKVKVYDETK